MGKEILLNLSPNLPNHLLKTESVIELEETILDHQLKILIKTIIIAATLLPFQVFAAPTASSRFDLMGHISQKTRSKELGVALLKDNQTKKTLVVQIGKPFMVEQTLFQLISLTDRGAIISDGKTLLLIGDAYTKATYKPQEAPPIVQVASSDIPKKIRISNKPMNAFKKARLISPKTRGSIQTRLESQRSIVEDAENIRQNEMGIGTDDNELIEQNYDETGFGTTANN